MEKIRTYKQRAKASLKNNWDKAIMVMLIISAIEIGIILVQTLLFKDSPILGMSFQLLASIILLIPLIWAMNGILLSVTRGEEIKIGHIWCAYHNGNFGRVLSISVVFILLSICISIVAAIPAIVILLLSGIELTSFSSRLIIIAFVIVALIIAYVYWSMTYFIMWDDARMKSMRAIKASARMVKGHFWRYLGLYLSFIGWYILGLISLGIGLLWIAPYLYTAQAHFYEDLKAEQLP